ncbi:MAG: UDP-N-acetylmuramoyl-L-alanine--D-glutamate ligase [Clostridiales bacterium]|nr:UDP-N-acetylmuramoyl-L-alanine--D-glutamate ligase [Clostridiales bacterium]
MDLTGKNVCVCGMARSGIAAAKLAKKAGAAVTVTDSKSEEKLKAEHEILSSLNITALCGKNPDDFLLSNTDLMIISPGLPYNLPFIQSALNKKITVLPEIEFASLFCEAKIAAITGTNGKTTTTALVGEIMKKLHPKSMALGNIGTAFSEYAQDIPGGAFAVLEMSSFQLEAAQNFKPDVAAVIQVTPDHLDRHKTMENYTKIKAKIFENQTETDFAVLNYDDEACRKMAANIRSKVIFHSAKRILDEGALLNERKLYAGTSNEGGIYGGIYLEGTKITAVWGGKKIYITETGNLKIPGGHNTENVLSAASISLALGAGAEVIREAAEAFAGVPHRIELVRKLGGVKYYNDSKATNPDSAIKGLLAMSGKTVLICGGYDKNADFSEWVKLFNGRVKKLVVLGETAAKIIKTCEDFNFRSYIKVNSLEEAVNTAKKEAGEGENVLLSPACASWDSFKDYEQRGEMFKEYVMALAGNFKML